MITSKLYQFFRWLDIVIIVLCAWLYFGDSRDTNSPTIFLGVELFLVAHAWWCFNFIDIYEDPDGRLYCYFRGTQMNIPADRTIGKIPLIVARVNYSYYRIGYISFRDEVARRRIKFFLIKSGDWHLLEDHEFA